MTKLLFITAELFPLVKTGGLADYSEAIPKVLHTNKNIDVRILLPAYPSVFKALKRSKVIAEINVLLEPNFKVQLMEGRVKGFAFPILAINAPNLYNREGSPYVDSGGHDWRDNFERFATLSMMPYLMIKNKLEWTPDVIHANDWHTGLCAAYLKHLDAVARPRTIFTIHNIAFQGIFSSTLLSKSGLPKNVYNTEGLEFFNKISFLKSGVNFSDKVVTVSPRYAEEISSTEEFGLGFSGILKEKKENFVGILNGVDYKIWTPSRDHFLNYKYTPKTIENKVKQKVYFQKSIGLAENKNAFLISSVSRLSYQKGLDLVYSILEELVVKCPILQFTCVGTGDATQENNFKDLAKRYPLQVKFFPVYDESLAHQAIGSSDTFLMPSRFEPCGLTQIYSLKYGTIPLVTPVGGLLDTVVPYERKKNKIKGTGFIAKNISEKAIQTMIEEAINIFKNEPKNWKKLISNGMKQNFSWKKSVQHYVKIYKKLLTDNK